MHHKKTSWRTKVSPQIRVCWLLPYVNVFKLFLCPLHAVDHWELSNPPYKSVLSNIVFARHMSYGYLNSIKRKWNIKFSSSVTLDPRKALSGHIWTVQTWKISIISESSFGQYCSILTPLRGAWLERASWGFPGETPSRRKMQKEEEGKWGLATAHMLTMFLTLKFSKGARSGSMPLSSWRTICWMMRSRSCHCWK